MKKIFSRMYENARRLNDRNILKLLQKKSDCNLLDLGCDDGTWTMQLANMLDTKNIFGIEVVDDRIKIAESKNIKVIKSDLNRTFPYESDFFDVVHANQVIEHITNLDNFIKEIRRVLKPGGYAIISTENASSWHNIFASIMGWQIFSLTNVICIKGGIGNPWALHRGTSSGLESWTHKTIFNYLGLIEIFEAYQFVKGDILGSGYHPLPAMFGSIDKRHAHFLAIKVFKS